MPAYNFKHRFANQVAAGIKRSTIRARRKDGRDAKPGQTLYLFTGMRTKQCRRLLETRCERVTPIRITKTDCYLSGRKLSIAEFNDLAIGDGFSDAVQLLFWFNCIHTLPFSGLYIQW